MAFYRTAFLGVALALGGCGDDGQTPSPPDFAVSAGDDLSTAAVDDLATPRDLSSRDWSFSFADGAGVCTEDGGAAGNDIVGTCVQAFFAKLASCWVPSGDCAYTRPANHFEQFCWTDGAGLQGYWSGGALVTEPPPTRFYVRGEFLCMNRFRPQGGTTDTWTAYDGTVLVVDAASGAVTCPDGTHVMIAPNYASCHELDFLVEPYASFSCPTAATAADPVPCPPSQVPGF